MPINVMLVDDEVIVRLGMKSVIDWEGNGFRYAGEASDGLEALAELDRVKPDIVLTDIKMPNMNGLELIEAVKRKDAGIRIVVLSSHDEFDYVRSAMKLGADDYILKASLDPDKLVRLLRETAGRLEPTRRTTGLDEAEQESGAASGPVREDALRQLLARSLEGQASPEEREHPAWKAAFAGRRAYVARIRAASQEGGRGAPLAHVLEQNARKWARVSLVKAEEKEALLVFWLPDGTAPDRLAEIGADLVSASARYAGMSVDIGFGGGCGGPGELAEGAEQAARALEASFFEEERRTFIYGETVPPDRLPGSPPALAKDEEKELATAVERLDEEQIRRAVESFFAQLKEAKPSVALAIQACLDLFYGLQAAFRKLGLLGERREEGRRPAYSDIIGFAKISQAMEWFNRYVSRSLDAVRSGAKERGREEIRALMAYMREHYAENLTLRQAAEMTKISEGYLSVLFKKEVGTGFVEYLNGLRVDKAAELLRNTHLPSYAIAEQVGYDNINYFGRIFKKIKGMSPKLYRANYSLPPERR